MTFSEAMDPASLTTSTFTLTKQAIDPVPALVSYQSQVATLDPNASLEANTSYTAKVKGGTGGAKDVAGNVLAADVSWSFTTAEATNRPPSPVIDTPASTLTWKVGDAVAFTGHASDPEQGRSRPPRSRGASPAALPLELPCAHDPELAWGRRRLVQRTRPRVPLLPRARADSRRRRGSERNGDSSPGSADGGFELHHFPLGLSLAVDGISQATPFARTVIVGSTNSLSAPTPQTLNGTTYQCSSWSDGNAQTHNVVASVADDLHRQRDRASTRKPLASANPEYSLLSAAPDRRQRSLERVAADDASYQWLRCATLDIGSCSSIPGATAQMYVPVPADTGFRLRKGDRDECRGVRIRNVRCDGTL